MMHIRNPFVGYWEHFFKNYKFSNILVHHLHHGINNTAHKNNNALEKSMIK